LKKYTEKHMKESHILKVSKHRNRIGCDICKKDIATQAFIGYVGDVLWICGKCFKKITKN